MEKHQLEEVVRENKVRKIRAVKNGSPLVKKTERQMEGRKDRHTDN